MANNKKENNFFTQSIAQKGEDFLNNMTSKDMQYAAIRIFRELARQKIDISKYGEYFLNRQFLNVLTQEAQLKYNIFEVSSIAVQNLIAMNPNMNHNSLSTAYEFQANSRLAYGILLEGFRGVAITSMPAVLITTIQKLKPYRNSI